MRRSMFQIALFICLGIPLASVPTAGAQGLRTKDRPSQVVRTTAGHRVHAPVRYTRRAHRPALRYAERARPAYRQVARKRSRPVVTAQKPAEGVYYYDNTLVGRDPDANVRLMLLRDNVRTMWAR